MKVVSIPGTMRTIFALAIPALMISGCTSMKSTASIENDDVYATSKDVPPQKQASSPAPASSETVVVNEPQKAQEPASTSVEQDNQGNTYIVNKYYDSDFDSDDYYDYEYSVRIRRFYNPISYYGYYDNYYTNSYWYSYNPHHWGISVYYGYPWWGPSYNTYCYYPSWYWYSSWNCGWGWGWYPGWSWGHHHGYWSGYNHGYNHGYWDGYWDGYYDGYGNSYYYNSHDNSGYYYGPRPTTTQSNGNSFNQHGSNFEQAMAVDGNGFTPVKGNASYQSDPRPTNAAMLQQGITAPGKGNTTANPYQSAPRPMAPVTTGADPKGNSTNSSNMNNLPIPSSTSGDGKGNTSGNPYQSAPRPMNPPAAQPQPNTGGSHTPNTYTPPPAPVPSEAPKGNPYQSEPRPRANSGDNAPPRSYEAPKSNEAPKPQPNAAPRNNDQPRQYQAPKSNPAPRQNSTPRSSGGSSGGHSKPSGGGGSFHRR